MHSKSKLRLLILLNFCLVFAIQSAFSQTDKIEKLKFRLKKEQIDSVKVEILYQLGRESFDFDFEVAFEYAQRCLALSKKIKYSKGLAMANTNVGLYYYFKGEYNKALEFYKNGIESLNNKTQGDFPAYTLTRIGNLYRVQGQYDSASHYYKRSINKLVGQQPGVALSSNYHNIGLLLMERSQFDSAIVSFRASVSIRKNLGDSLLIAESWRGLGTAFTELGEYDSATQYFHKIKLVADSFNNPELKMFHALYYGELLYQQERILEAIEQLNIGLDILSDHPFTRYRVKSLYFLGIIFAEIGEYEKGASYFFEALKLNKSLKNLKQDAEINYELAWIYNQLKNQLLATQYANKSLELYSKIRFEKGIADANNMLGSIALNWNENDRAIEYYSKSLGIYKRNGIKKSLAAVLFNISLTYDAMGQYEKVFPLQFEALKIEEEFKNTEGIIISYNYLGKMFIKSRNYDSSQFYLLKGRELLNKFDMPIYYMENTLFLAELNMSRENYEAASVYYREYAKLVQSVYESESLLKTIQLNVAFQLEKKDDEIKSLNKNKIDQSNQIQLQKDKLNQQRIILILSSLAIIFFAAFSFMLFRYNKKIAKARDVLKTLNLEIQEQKEEIETQSEELTEANLMISSINEKLEEKVEHRTQSLKEANEELDTFFYKSSHDFRRPLTTFIGLAQLGKMDIKDNAAFTIFDKIEDNAYQLDLMLSKLQSMSIVNSSELNLTNITFKKIIDDTVSKYNKELTDNNITFSSDIENIKLYKSYIEIHTIIIENLISNGIIFNVHGGTLSIAIKNIMNSIIIEVVNTGEKIQNESIPHIFEMFYRGSIRSTGNGLGLYITKKAVEKLNGTIDLKQSNEQNTIISLVIPIKLDS